MDRQRLDRYEALGLIHVVTHRVGAALPTSMQVRRNST